MVDNDFENIFDFDFLTALSNWQNGWYEVQDSRRILADELVDRCKKLPLEFKTYTYPCFRKRFTLPGELVHILDSDELFEGIASWSTKIDGLRTFKGYLQQGKVFAMVFKHIPQPEEIIININSLWTNEHFKKAANKFKEERPDAAKALFNFKDIQSEIILRSTLKGSEIEDIVGESNSFEQLCDKAGIPENEREARSIEYAKNPNGILIELKCFAGPNATKRALNTVKKDWDLRKKDIAKNNGSINYDNLVTVHPDDLKHKS